MTDYFSQESEVPKVDYENGHHRLFDPLRSGFYPQASLQNI